MKIIDVKETKCLHCQRDIPKRVPMKNSRDGAMQKGMIMVCSYCGGAMILGDMDWRKMEKQDFDKLDHQSKLSLVMLSKAMRNRLDTGKEWSPYEGSPIK